MLIKFEYTDNAQQKEKLHYTKSKSKNMNIHEYS